MSGWRKLRSAIDVTTMASKYLELRAKGAGRGRFRVPRGGGARTKGSFDTVDRYRQHSVAKR